MADVDLRERTTRNVYQHLQHPDFRRHLSATAEDGSHPVIVALVDDPMSEVLAKVRAADWAGNLVTPVANGYVVVAMQASVVADAPGASIPALTPECTYGVFLARLIEDGCDSGAYQFVFEGPGKAPQRGRAKLALAVAS